MMCFNFITSYFYISLGVLVFGASSMSWFNIPANSDFSLINLPFGVFSLGGSSPRCGVAIGDHVIDLVQLHAAGLFNDLPFDASIFGESTLNSFMALDRPAWRAMRAKITSLLSSASDADSRLKDNVSLQSLALVPMDKVQMHMPATIGDYTDFYSSREHATNVGIMFRGKDNALQPNWLHLPVGYHGRASSVVLSGTDVVRPKGQLQVDKTDPSKGSIYDSCKLMDFELETGFFVGGSTNPLGRALTMEEAEDHIFGAVLLNDWSARDIQAWEYVPLGPFTAKNFATSISPWVVTIDALEAFRCSSSAGAEQVNPTPLDYIRDKNYEKDSYNVNLQVAIKPEGSEAAFPVSNTNWKYMYWNMKQQLVHHSVSGCNMKPGDLLGSGTISGTTDEALGSMLELSWRGSREVKLQGSDMTRKFLKDGDEVIMSGYAENALGQRVGFGKVTGKILPAGSLDNEPLSVASKSTSAYHSFKLHSYYRSTASWRVRIALAMKGIEYTYIPVDLMKLAGDNSTKMDRETAELNPMEQIPILEFVDSATNTSHVLTQSVAIIEFLQEAFPGGASLFPTNTVQRAHVRQCAEIVNSGVAPLQNLAVLRQVKAVELTGTGEAEAINGKSFGKHNIERGLTALEAIAKAHYNGATGAKFLGGTMQPSIGDICLIPQLYNARRFEVDLSAFPTLTAIEENCKSLPFFEAAKPESQPDFR